MIEFILGTLFGFGSFMLTLVITVFLNRNTANSVAEILSTWYKEMKDKK